MSLCALRLLAAVDSRPPAALLLFALQDQGNCSACVVFAVTAAAEAAVNVYTQQNWNSISLSEQDLICGWVL
jgi:C1A family cysteine protease